MRHLTTLILFFALMFGVALLYLNNESSAAADSTAASVTAAAVVGAPAAAAASSAAATASSVDGAKKAKGGGFFKSLLSPFKALGRLFGSKGKQSSSDASKTQVVEAKPAPTVAPPSLPTSPPPAQTKALAAAAEDAGANVMISRPSEENRVTASIAPLPIVVEPKGAKESKGSSKGSEERIESVKSPAPSRPNVAGQKSSVAFKNAVPVLFTGVVAPGQAMSVPSDRVGDSLGRGRMFLEKGEIDRAIAELSVATATGPDVIEANNLLGNAYDRKGLYQQAQECYRRVLSAVPKEARALNNMGCSLYLQGEHRAALDWLKKANGRLPNNPHILQNLALAQGRLGKYGDAYRSFARAGGELHARLNVAALLEQAGRLSDAIKHYKEAYRLSPSTAIIQRLAILDGQVNSNKNTGVAYQPLVVQ